MTKIEYDIFREAAGHRALSADKTQIGFRYLENGEVEDSESFSVSELKEHINKLKARGQETAIYEKALKEAEER